MKTHAPVASPALQTQESGAISFDRGRFQKHRSVVCLVLAIIALMVPLTALHAANSSGECYVTVNVSGSTLPSGWSYQLQYLDTDSNWYNGASGTSTQTYYKQQGDWANRSIQWRCQLKQNNSNYGSPQTNTCYAGSDSVSFSVAAPVTITPPTITGQPSSQSVSAGASVTFTVSASGTAPLSYQWRKNGGNISGATSTSHTIVSVSTGDAGNYTCYVSNSAGNATSQEAVLTVSSGPQTPSNGSWILTGQMLEERSGHSATLLNDGKVLIAGGENTASAELYNPMTRQWEATGAMNQARANHTAILLTNGKVLVAGGQASSGVTTTAELYDPGSQTWSVVGAMNTGRAGHRAVLMQSGRVLVAGGWSGLNVLKSAEVFDPASSQWTLVGIMNSKRVSPMMTLLSNGEVLICGGRDGSSIVNGYLSSCEIYSPATETWRLTGSMSENRSPIPSATLPNGNVLAIGGHVNNYSIVSTAEQYNPLTGVWQSVGLRRTLKIGPGAKL